MPVRNASPTFLSLSLSLSLSVLFIYFHPFYGITIGTQRFDKIAKQLRTITQISRSATELYMRKKIAPAEPQHNTLIVPIT